MPLQPIFVQHRLNDLPHPWVGAWRYINLIDEQIKVAGNVDADARNARIDTWRIAKVDDDTHLLFVLVAPHLAQRERREESSW
jgi:hypothetical protein